jgi:hypothetical protein
MPNNERGFLTLQRVLLRPVVLQSLHVRLESPNALWRLSIVFWNINNTFVLLPGWILTIALQSFPITGAVPVSTLMSIYGTIIC